MDDFVDDSESALFNWHVYFCVLHDVPWEKG